jgi:hypothetical protein
MIALPHACLTWMCVEQQIAGLDWPEESKNPSIRLVKKKSWGFAGVSGTDAGVETRISKLKLCSLVGLEPLVC